MEDTIINRVASASDITLVEMLATKIWQEHYPDIIGKEQVDYMLAKYQSCPAIKRQLNDGASYYLLFEKNHPVGYFSYHFESDALFLNKIYVIKEVRGNGVGTKAIKYIASKALEQSAKKVRLAVNKFNSKTIEVYKNIGFKTVDSVEKDIGAGFIMDDYIMELSLSESIKQRGESDLTQSHARQGQVA
ncbi:GNAT family N-acetyltransferase [Kangiella japonica]|uniref:GNAT family N-acetyltransferase n=1 Tax=Kangiella japonica TaxID=647384 RepID=A0ABN0T6W4_9GAMM